MDNYVQKGNTLTLTAPYALASGDGFQVGAIFAVALADALISTAVEGQTEGVFTLAKTSAQAWTVGQKIYWDNSNKRCDTDGTVGMLIGAATAVAANPSAIGQVRLNGCSPSESEGPQAAIPDVSTANATDLATAQALANALKASYNTLLGELRTAGILLP
jgi:predicted RecA/RadA family phage recombinase